MVRFLQQLEAGSGDYTKERSAWLDHETLESLVNEIRQNRSKSDDL